MDYFQRVFLSGYCRRNLNWASLTWIKCTQKLLCRMVHYYCIWILSHSILRKLEQFTCIVKATAPKSAYKVVIFPISIIIGNVLFFKSTLWYYIILCHKYSDQIRSVAQSCPTLCDPRNYSTPGLPVHHQFPEFTQTHVHWASDAIQPSHPLSFPSPPAPNPSQHQSLFQWVNSSHEVAKVLEFQL